MLRGDTYGFLKKMIETIKQTKDVSAPTDPAENEAAQKVCPGHSLMLMLREDVT